MEYSISQRMASMKPSLVREILKASADPTVIAFSAGNPAPNAFPTEQIAAITAQILRERPIDALQYSVTEGYAPLREALWSLCETHYGIPRRENDDLIIISGGQQGADLLTKAMVNEGDTVLCENPSFIGCLNCFRSYNARLVGVEMEADGVDLAQLEHAMKTEPNVRFFYMIPNFQNPSGITTSLEKRQKVLALANRYGVIVLEDNPYGDLRYEGDPIPSLKSIDDTGAVVYVGSFSKILAPGLRVGFAIAPKPLLAKMVVGKQCADVHTTALTQIICEQFITTCDLKGHLARLQEIYRAKCRLMLDGIDAEFSPSIHTTRPQGGLFVWCTLPEGADMQDFCKKAIEHKVAVVPGVAFLADESAPCRAFRMNFSTPSDEAIVEGVKRLGALSRTLYQ